MKLPFSGAATALALTITASAVDSAPPARREPRSTSGAAPAAQAANNEKLAQERAHFIDVGNHTVDDYQSYLESHKKIRIKNPFAKKAEAENSDVAYRFKDCAAIETAAPAGGSLLKQGLGKLFGQGTTQITNGVNQVGNRMTADAKRECQFQDGIVSNIVDYMDRHDKGLPTDPTAELIGRKIEGHNSPTSTTSTQTRDQIMLERLRNREHAPQ